MCMETLALSTPGPEVRAEQFTASLHAQRDRAAELFAAQQTRLDQAESLIDRQLQRLEEEVAAQRAEADRLRDERDRLSIRLSHSEAHATRHPKRLTALPGDGPVSSDDYHRRYEMALDDLHDLKAKNAELQQQLAKANASAGDSAGKDQVASGHLDWEAEKRRIFAALDAEFDDGDAQQRGERLKIEDVLRSTSQILAEKDHQIDALQRQLEEQCATHAAIESEKAALDRAVNADMVIQQERDRLVQLQKQWQEKLRQAEIEVSLERAKLARQRADLEEQFHVANNEASRPPTAAGSAGHGERPAGGQWLARLGLTEADRERRR
jgi:hypothetical protein